MKQKIFRNAMSVGLICGLLGVPSLWGQKQLPAVVWSKKTPLQILRADKMPFAPLKMPKIKGPISYIPPKRIDLKRLEQLSSEMERLVLLRRPSSGLLRNWEAIATFSKGQASPSMRLLAAVLSRVGLTHREMKLFLNFYPFMTTETKFSYQNNTRLLQLAAYFKTQVDDLKQQKKEILGALSITQMDRPRMLTNAIPDTARLIMVGEVHNRAGQRQQLIALLREYRARYPQRKMVLFSEFLPSYHPRFWKVGQAIPAEFFDKRPDFSNEVYQLGKKLDMEIYGLEDLRLVYTTIPAESQLPVLESNMSFLGMMVRNEHWAKIMQQVMQRIRQQDPETVFFVYAGNGHLNKAVVGSLSYNLQEYNPFVISLNDGFQDGFLGLLLKKDSDVLSEVSGEYRVTWKEGKNFSEAVGFDVKVLVPLELKPTDYLPNK